MLQDETLRLPAVKVHLKECDYLDKEVFDFLQMANPHPVNVAFAVYSAIKRLVGSTRRSATTHNYPWTTIAPSTELIRRFFGFTGGAKETVKFSSDWADGTRGCPRSWDALLGHRWDVLHGLGAERQDKVIRTMKFSEHRDFGCFTVRCHITTLPGRFRHEEDYRSVLLHNYEESCKVDQYVVAE